MIPLVKYSYLHVCSEADGEEPLFVFHGRTISAPVHFLFYMNRDSLDPELDCSDFKVSPGIVELVLYRVIGIHLQLILIHPVTIVHGMRPSQVLVHAMQYTRGTCKQSPGYVQSFLTAEMCFIESLGSCIGLVGIDE